MEVNLDLEFKRYLQIMRPYLTQLADQDVIEICGEWIKRLSNCDEKEKGVRNQYVFALCYQLAKGVLNLPFLRTPPEGALPPLREGFDSETSTETNYIIIDANEENTKILYNNKKPILSETDYPSQDNEFDDYCKYENSSRDFDSFNQTPSFDKSNTTRCKQTVICVPCAEAQKEYETNNPSLEEQYEYRAQNLIIKLREIKTQNVLLHKEVQALREESLNKNCKEDVEMINTGTSTMHRESNTTLESLKSLQYKLEHMEEDRESLKLTVLDLISQLDHYKEIKQNEVDDLRAKHKLELIKIKTAAREECKTIYGDKLEELTNHYETLMKDIQRSNEIRIDQENKTKDGIIHQKDALIQEKDKIIQNKENEIENLKLQLQEQKNYLQTVVNKIADKPNATENVESDTMKLRVQDLEKRLTKMERVKAKCIKSYEAKLASLQREKHLTECSLQLQLVRQRAQVFNELSDDNQTELSGAFDKLEAKYKDIVANVQATAIQRRMQDQLALETVLRAACSVQSGARHPIHGQFSGKPVKHVKDSNQSCESVLSDMIRNKMKMMTSYETEPKYCLDSEGLEELFHKVYIPQRDTGDGPLKK